MSSKQRIGTNFAMIEKDKFYKIKIVRRKQ